MDCKKTRLDSSTDEAIRDRLMREELEARARTSAAAERAMPQQAVGEWIESLREAKSRSGARAR